MDVELVRYARGTHVRWRAGTVHDGLAVVSWRMHVDIVPNRSSRPAILLREA